MQMTITEKDIFMKVEVWNFFLAEVENVFQMFFMCHVFNIHLIYSSAKI